MNKSLNRIVAAVMGVVMAVSAGTVSVFADSHNVQNSATMNPKTIVYEIGEKSFYKVNDDGTITFADRQEDDTYNAVPSKYISGSEYWDDDAGIYYGLRPCNKGECNCVGRSRYRHKWRSVNVD